MIKQIIIILILSCTFIKGYAQEDWQVAPSDYEYSMTLTGVVSLNDSLYEQTEDIVVAAFVDDTVCVGKSEARYYDKVGKYRVPLMVYGNESGAVINLKVYFPDLDSTCIITDVYEFQIDASYGNYGTPVIWETDMVTMIEEDKVESFSVYPNPARDYVTIDGVEQANVQVFDYSGKRVFVPIRSNIGKCQLDISSLKAGFYLISVNDDNNRKTQKLIVK